MRIVVIANCQGFGLGSSIEALLPEAEVQVISLEHLPSRHAPIYEECLRSALRADLVVTQPLIGDYGQLTTAALRESCPAVVVVPAVIFGGFHPDCCYLFKSGQPVESGTHHYHSALVAGAYLAELAPDRVPGLFNEFVYRGLGFHEEFELHKADLTTMLERYGYDAAPVFGARPVFMHTVNHPCIEVLFDMAGQVLRKAGLRPSANASMPKDRLAMEATVWPVYPEIAAGLGVAGSLEFRHGPLRFSHEQLVGINYHSYAAAGLEFGEFESLAVRRALDFLQRHVNSRHVDRYEHFGSRAASGHGDRYRFGDNIAFGVNAASERYLINGWSEPEPGFVWMSGHEAAFAMRPMASSLPSSAPPGFWLELDCFPMTYPGSIRQTQRLEILVNGTEVHRGDYGGASKVRVAVPAAAINLHEPIVVALRAPEASRPIDVNPTNPDTRLLGFAVQRAALRLAP